MESLKVGQKLWCVPKYRPAHEVVVVKIGRKYASIGKQQKIDINTLEIVGEFVSPGRCYMSKNDYKNVMELISTWAGFRNRIPYQPPAGVTDENIKTAMKLLRLE